MQPCSTDSVTISAMTFENVAPCAIRSVRQLDLLNSWIHALQPGQTLPRLRDYRPSRVADELINMMAFDVIGDGETARFLITHEGARLTQVYGNDYPARDLEATRFLDDAIGPQRYRVVEPFYRACLKSRLPTYSISLVRDADGKEVSYERLLLPFANEQRIDGIVGSYVAISAEGNFKVRNLMGIDTDAPIAQVRAHIDPALARSRPARASRADEVIEG
jgi:hypothetical protein